MYHIVFIKTENIVVDEIGREKGRDLPQSYYRARTPTENPKSNVTRHINNQKLRLHNDCGPT